ncbi:hypothetical protein J4463_01270 [Candidatus Pacearchaeota archaeon]|nr:hypothetical protein [Candidatus Pacearchaeota archaeon]
MNLKKCAKCNAYTMEKKCLKCASETKDAGYKFREKFMKNLNKEGIMTMLASEKSLKKDWDNKLDKRWNK